MKKVGDFMLDRSGDMERYNKLGRSYRRHGVSKVKPFAGGVSVGEKDTQYADSDFDRPPFRVGQFDNPGAMTTSTGIY